jgi:DedD protein
VIFSIDERTKHRLTGLAVILAVAIIFVPAMIKKSNQRLEENIHLSVQLPPKPSAPKVVMAQKDAMFEAVNQMTMEVPVTAAAPAIQVAQADVEPSIENSEALDVAYTTRQRAAARNRARNVGGRNNTTVVVTPPPTQAAKPAAKAPPPPAVTPVVGPPAVPVPEATKAARPAPTQPAAKAKPEAKAKPAPAVKPSPRVAQASPSLEEAYAVQLASFNMQANAKALVSRLQSRGYQARYHTKTSDVGDVYKVTVGQLETAQDARQLKEKISQSIHLDGFVVKHEVS